LLRLENISKFYNNAHKTICALDRISLEISKGDFVAVNGASGCGKTTLLLVAGTLLQPDEGRVFLEDREITGLTAAKGASIRAHNIGFIFQQYHLVPYLSVGENIKLPALARKDEVPEERLSELVHSLGLKERLDHTPAELSAGERQRTALARALLYEPKLLLADEITGNLDEINSEIVMRFLTDYTNSGGTVLLVTHDKMVREHINRVFIMDKGSIQEETV
jgi:ABC-type lipoprotein export system ATPase subunit